MLFKLTEMHSGVFKYFSKLNHTFIDLHLQDFSLFQLMKDFNLVEISKLFYKSLLKWHLRKKLKVMWCCLLAIPIELSLFKKINWLIGCLWRLSYPLKND